MTTNEPIVAFWKNTGQGGNGAFRTETTAVNTDEFLGAVASALPDALRRFEGDEEYTLLQLLPQICEIWASLRGFNGDVTEKRRLCAGDPGARTQV
jgi:hypothetical protein